MPEKPKKFKICSTTETSIRLKWEPPETDSWTPLQKYVFKQYTTNSNGDCLTVPLPEGSTHYLITNINPKEKYLFRLNGANITGKGEFAECDTGMLFGNILEDDKYDL